MKGFSLDLLLLHRSSSSRSACSTSGDHPDALVLYRRQARQRPVQRVLRLGAPSVVHVHETPLDLGDALELDLQREARVVRDAQRRVRVHHLFFFFFSFFVHEKQGMKITSKSRGGSEKEAQKERR